MRTALPVSIPETTAWQPPCAIWGTPVAALYSSLEDRILTVTDSSRTDGSYTIERDAAARVESEFGNEAKARLTSYLVQSRQFGRDIPHIGQSAVENTQHAPRKSAHERAMSLLGYFASQTSSIGEAVRIDLTGGPALAWSESIGGGEVKFLAKYLKDHSLIHDMPMTETSHDIRVLVDGYSHLEESRQAARPLQAFVAMWFDESMAHVYDEAIRPAIEAAGFKALRIDRKHLVGKVDDEIIREIRRSRFMVADFTHGEDGHRGSVYYEAGFARGIGLPVISTCEEDKADGLAFDTRQYLHILWKDTSTLQAELANRIGASIGEGSTKRETMTED